PELCGSERVLDGGDGIVNVAAAAASERVGFEAGNPCLVEPRTEGFPGWWYSRAAAVSRVRTDPRTFATGTRWPGSLQRIRRRCSHSLIKQGHELPDDVTRKNGHGNVSVALRPATSGDSAD